MVSRNEGHVTSGGGGQSWLEGVAPGLGAWGWDAVVTRQKVISVTSAVLHHCTWTRKEEGAAVGHVTGGHGFFTKLPSVPVWWEPQVAL